jgi:hypothetical protein
MSPKAIEKFMLNRVIVGVYFLRYERYSYAFINARKAKCRQ